MEHFGKLWLFLMCKEGACKRKTYRVSRLAQLHLQRAELLKAAHFHSFVWQGNAQKCKKMRCSWSPSLFWIWHFMNWTSLLDWLLQEGFWDRDVCQWKFCVIQLQPGCVRCSKKLLSIYIFKEIMRFLRFHIKRDGNKGWCMTNFAWPRYCEVFLLRRFRWCLCLVLT